MSTVQEQASSSKDTRSKDSIIEDTNKTGEASCELPGMESGFKSESVPSENSTVNSSAKIENGNCVKDLQNLSPVGNKKQNTSRNESESDSQKQGSNVDPENINKQISSVDTIEEGLSIGKSMAKGVSDDSSLSSDKQHDDSSIKPNDTNIEQNSSSVDPEESQSSTKEVTTAFARNTDSVGDSENQNSAVSAAPDVQLRNHVHKAHGRNHFSVLSCPEVVNLAQNGSGDSNVRRHSMDIFDVRQRLKRKKAHYKSTDISGPICNSGDGPASTMRTRPIRSVNSESNLLHNVKPSSLTVNMTEYILNSSDQPPFIISWDITCSISSLDCISLYLKKEDDVPELVSFRNAGVGYMPKGEITWDLNQHQEKFTSETNFVVFKYYHPTSTGGLSLVASSEQITIYNKNLSPARSGSTQLTTSDSMRTVVGTSLNHSNSEIVTLILSDLCGYNLKRGVFFNPDPYVKIAVFPGPRCAKQPHHKQLYRTKQAGNTINPVWKEQFFVQVLPSDLVELEVKDRFDRSRPILRRFLGRLLIPVQKLQDVIAHGGERFTEALGKRTPIDQTSGSLSFLVTTAKRHPSFVIAPKPYGAVPLSLNAAPSSGSLESETPSSQASNDEENYSSDVSSGNSESPETTAPVYVPDTETVQSNNSSSAADTTTEETPEATTQPSETVEPGVEARSGDLQANTEAVVVNSEVTAVNSEPVQAKSPELEAAAVAQEPAQKSPDIVKETPVQQPVEIIEPGATASTPNGGDKTPKNIKILKLKEISPNHPLASPRERSPMRKNRLDAVSFFPSTDDGMTPTDIPSLRNMSLSVVSKKAEEKDLSKEGATGGATVPSLLRLSSIELQKSGAVGTTHFNSSGPSPQTILPPQFGASAQPETEHDGPSTSAVAKSPTTSSDGDTNVMSNSEGRTSPVSEFLSITIRRPKGTALGLSIVGGANSSKPQSKQQIRVSKVERNSPAEEAGAKVGDRLLAVNAQSMVNVNHDTAVAAIRNSGTEVVIQVERKLNAKTKRRYSKNSHAPRVRTSEIRDPAAAKRKLPFVANKQTAVSESGPSNSSGAVRLPSAFDARFRASRHRIMSRTDLTPESEIPSQEGLPPNWEAFKDRHGRIYYVDHENRMTQWNHPTHSPTPTGEPARGGASSVMPNNLIVPGAATLRRRNSTEGDRNYESAMKRYQSIKRAMKRQSRVIGEEEEGESSRSDVTDSARIHSPLSAGEMEAEEPTSSAPTVRITGFSKSVSPVAAVAVPSGEDAPDSQPTESDSRPKYDVMSSPGCKFITHPGFRDLLIRNEEAHNFYQSSSVLKYIISKVSRNSGYFIKYQHNKDLVRFINIFANTSQDLPPGWETRKEAAGKSFFIDHTHKMTTFIDPRLPLIDEPTASGSRLEPESNNRASNNDNRAPVQSPLVTEHPPPIPPRPERTLTDASSRVDPAESVASESSQQDLPTAYNEKVVAFLQQPNILEILKERHPEIGTSDSLKERIMVIRTEGVSALERLSYSVNLTMMLSKFHEEIMNFVPKSSRNRSVFAETTARNRSSSPHGSPGPASTDFTKAITRSRAPAPYRRDFELKLHNFYKKLDSKGYGKGPNKIKMQVRRDHLLEDAFQKVKSLSRKELQRSKLNISFAGEEGLDYSGPSREFFFLVSRELFNPYYGLFEYSAVDTYTVQISPMSAYIDDPMDWFHFAGRIIGLALIHHYLLDAFFTRPLYKALLRAKCDISDLQYIDEQFYNSLMWMKDNDITDVLDLNFTADEEVFGQVVEKELKPNGKNIVVTEKNKKEYIEKIVKWRVNRSCREQTNKLVRGFNDVIDLRLVSVFDARELELVLCGTAEIDLNDWRQNTEYRGGYHDTHLVIKWFWEALEKFDNERRLRLLQFVTGTSSIPYEGFSALRGPNGPKKFCIEKWGKVHFLPRAHTCFNRIDLPAYPSFQVLWEKMTIAVEETSTFGIE